MGEESYQLANFPHAIPCHASLQKSQTEAFPATELRGKMSELANWAGNLPKPQSKEIQKKIFQRQGQRILIKGSKFPRCLARGDPVGEHKWRKCELSGESPMETSE